MNKSIIQCKNSTKKFISFVYLNILYLDTSVNGSVKIPSIKVAFDKANPSIGVGTLAWSPDSSYLASKNGSLKKSSRIIFPYIKYFIFR